MQLNFNTTQGEILATEGLNRAVTKADRDYYDWPDRCESEVWKDVIGYDYPYQVSNLGGVRLLDRKTCNNSQLRKERKKIITGRVMKQRLRKEYYAVYLRKNKKTATMTVHRLVALSFIDNPENKPCINHKDGNKLNNNSNNLEWCTVGENTRHAYDNGLAKWGEDRSNSKLTATDVQKIRDLIRSGMIKTHIARLFKVSKSTVYAINGGQNWKRLKTA